MRTHSYECEQFNEMNLRKGQVREMIRWAAAPHSPWFAVTFETQDFVIYRICKKSPIPWTFSIAEGSQVQRGWVTCPRPHSLVGIWPYAAFKALGDQRKSCASLVLVYLSDRYHVHGSERQKTGIFFSSCKESTLSGIGKSQVQI